METTRPDVEARLPEITEQYARYVQIAELSDLAEFAALLLEPEVPDTFTAPAVGLVIKS